MPESVKIPASEVRRWLETGEPVTMLDARGRSAYARSGERIEGDLRVEGTRGLPEVLGELSRNGRILAYCT
jgi:hypothetical protein